MNRKPINSLEGKTIAKITIEERGRWFEFRNKSGRIIFTVTRDHLYDGQGNYFSEVEE